MTALGQVLGSRTTRPAARSVAILTAAAYLGAVLLAGTIAHGTWLLAGASVGVILLLRWPVETSLGSFFFLLPFDSIRIEGITAGTSLLWFSGAATAMVLLATAAIRNRWQRPPRAMWWWMLLMLWSASTYLWALKPNLVTERLPTAFSLWMLLMVVLSFRITSIELRRLSFLLVAGAVTAAWISGGEFLSGSAGATRASLAINNMRINPNTFAGSLLLPAAVALGCWAASLRWSMRALSIGAVVTIAAGLFITMSRGALLGFVVMLAFFIVRQRIKLNLALPLIAISLILATMPPIFFTRLQTAVQSRGAGRVDIWEAGLSALSRYGLVGAGVDNFPVAYDQFAGNSSRYRGGSRDPHNVFLAVAVETGIVGFILFLAALSSHFQDFRRFRRQLGGVVPAQIAAAEAACWGVLVDSLFEHSLWRKTFWCVWIFGVISLAAFRHDWRARDAHRQPASAFPSVMRKR